MKHIKKNIFSVENYYKQAARIGLNAKEICLSGRGRPIIELQMGSGDIKLLVIARLHGNEPAPTQAVLDFFKEYTNNLDGIVKINGIFMANPDGAALYEKKWKKQPEALGKNNFEEARLNAKGVDLNRDWLNLNEQETQCLQNYIISLRPNIVIDLHEFYWDEDFPPKYPTDVDDGFLATMTDCPFYLVNKGVSAFAEKLMYDISDKLSDEFHWKTKLRHFIGDKHDTYENPAYLGIYLALRGIPKLLVETWGVGCSDLLYKKRVTYHKKAIEYSIAFIKQNKKLLNNISNNKKRITFHLAADKSENNKRFILLLKKHKFDFTLESEEVHVNCLSVEEGFVKTVYYLTINQEN